jgi:hypothetical protein
MAQLASYGIRYGNASQDTTSTGILSVISTTSVAGRAASASSAGVQQGNITVTSTVGSPFFYMDFDYWTTWSGWSDISIRQYSELGPVQGNVIRHRVNPVAYACGTANEGSQAGTTIPSGFNFSSVYFASYGTPNGSCPNFSQSGCHSGSSATVVNSYASGKTGGQDVVVPSNNSVFGDPCGGTAKRLYYALACTTQSGNPQDYVTWYLYNPGLGGPHQLSIKLWWQS